MEFWWPSLALPSLIFSTLPLYTSSRLLLSMSSGVVFLCSFMRVVDILIFLAPTMVVHSFHMTVPHQLPLFYFLRFSLVCFHFLSSLAVRNSLWTWPCPLLSTIVWYMTAMTFSIFVLGHASLLIGYILFWLNYVRCCILLCALIILFV